VSVGGGSVYTRDASKLLWWGLPVVLAPGLYTTLTFLSSRGGGGGSAPRISICSNCSFQTNPAQYKRVVMVLLTEQFKFAIRLELVDYSDCLHKLLKRIFQIIRYADPTT
jgi:hypothetical protein